MTTETTNAYLKTTVLTASPEQLRLLLLDGAIKFAMQGREGLERKDYESVYNGFTRSRTIVLELTSGLSEAVDPKIRANISALYTFIYTQLVEASFEKDKSKADKAIELLEFERETWVLAMEQAAKERGRSQSGTPAAASKAAASVSVPAGASERTRR